MSLDFYDANHASLRLSNTIVRLKGLPVYIGEIHGDWSVSIQHMDTDKIMGVPDIREVKGLDLTPVPLGFVQVGKRAFYVMRKPSRRTKQGLSEEALFVTEYGGSLTFRRSADLRKALSNTILGVFPKLQSALEMLAKGFISVPIHRNWAVGKYEDRIYLVYKYSSAVGEWDADTKWFKLLKDFVYLQEALDVELKHE